MVLKELFLAQYDIASRGVDGVGTVATLTTRGRDLEFPAEQVLRFMLKQAVDVAAR